MKTNNNFKYDRMIKQNLGAYSVFPKRQVILAPMFEVASYAKAILETLGCQPRIALSQKSDSCYLYVNEKKIRFSTHDLGMIGEGEHHEGYLFGVMYVDNFDTMIRWVQK